MRGVEETLMRAVACMVRHYMEKYPCLFTRLGSHVSRSTLCRGYAMMGSFVTISEKTLDKSVYKKLAQKAVMPKIDLQ